MKEPKRCANCRNHQKQSWKNGRFGVLSVLHLFPDYVRRVRNMSMNVLIVGIRAARGIRIMKNLIMNVQKGAVKIGKMERNYRR